MNITTDWPSDAQSGVGLAILCLALGGIPTAALALGLTTRTSPTGAGWSAAWHTAFVIGLVFQACSLVVSVLLALSTEWRMESLIPRFLWANSVCCALGLPLWRGLRARVAPSTLPRIVGRDRAG